MTTAFTKLPADRHSYDAPYNPHVHGFGTGTSQVWEHSSGTANDDLLGKFSDYVILSCTGTAQYEVAVVQYGEGSGAWVIVDFQEPTSEFPEEHQEVVDYLRDYGRPLLAEQLVEMLRNVGEDSDEPLPKIVSLRDMARLIVEHRNFADPFIGPDGSGFVHAQWRILNDGMLVVVFLGFGQVLLVAQADKGHDARGLDLNIHGEGNVILEKYGYLVPRR